MTAPRIRGDQPASYSLTGEFNTRLQRLMQFFMQTDPTSSGQGPSQLLTLSSEAQCDMLIADLTGAPFRKFGQGWSGSVRIPAQATLFSTYLVMNNSQDPDAVLIEKIRVSGSAAAGVRYGFVKYAQFLFQTPWPFNLEERQSATPNVSPASAGTSKPSVIISSVESLNALYTAAQADEIGQNGHAAGPGPFTEIALSNPVVLWPGYCFYLQQDVVNLGFNITLEGRLFRFSKLSGLQV